MSNPANNPLFKHFRKPAIYLRLPSGGKFYPDDAIDFPPIGEIPVYPMTVKDELILKTPDALMNGEGMVAVVKSCVPNIKDPWQMPAVDVDAIFIAIRLASYGEGLEVKTKCPHCNADNEHTVDLRFLLDNLKQVDYDTSVNFDGLLVKFRPQSYTSINKTNIITFEEQRLVDQIINNDQLSDEEKAAKFKESFEKLKNLNIESVESCIESITAEDGTVVKDQTQIIEFLNNCSREIYAGIKKQIEKLITDNKLAPMNLSCEECEKPYTTQLLFDQSNFFE
jgi:hypothetical protein